MKENHPQNAEVMNTTIESDERKFDTCRGDRNYMRNKQPRTIEQSNINWLSFSATVFAIHFGMELPG